MTTALLLAADDPEWQGAGAAQASALSRLADQLASIGVDRVRVIAPPRRARELREASGAEVTECEDTVAALRTVTAIARTSDQALAVLPADLVAHREALARLLADPPLATAGLFTSDVVGEGGLGNNPCRLARGLVVSAGSSYHHVNAPNADFTGALRVAARDAATLGDAADGLAALAEKECLTDACSLLLVGLVRAGVAVAARDLGSLYCRRAVDRAGAVAATLALREVDEERLRLDAAVKTDDGFFATYFVSPYAKHVARFAARHGLAPNAVTLVSLGVGVAAAACFALGSRVGLVAGALLVQAAFALDCVDGQLARYTRTFSTFGGWLDGVTDRAEEYIVYAGLAAGATGVWPLAVAALTMQTTRHMIDFGYGALPQAPAAGPPSRSLVQRDDVPVRGTSHPAETSGTASGRRVGAAAAGLSARLESHGVARWLKKIVILPVGERLLLISVTAAFFDARVTFLALLVWGGLAGLYMLGGRFARSLARGPEEAKA
ncbi:MAG: CDP-alcohol phosphatidyltransferase family protein [Streptosporangiaceae bacterium]